MKISLNGQPKELASPMNLNTLVKQVCQNPGRVIAEVNGNIIKSHAWEAMILKDGDKVELVNFVGGG